MNGEMTGIGIIGCGKISGIYLENLTQNFPGIKVAACADLDSSRAQEVAEKYPEVRACSVDELLNSPDVSIVLNLTIPAAHYDVACCAIEAGKHVYNEKPLTVDLDEAEHLMATAATKNLLVGCAPDTVLGAGIQTCRKLIDDGLIGRPVAATAFMMCHGHESWHPNPFFYYEPGGGPLFDMGPYYLSALLTLLGPVRRVSGSVSKSFETRTITAEPHQGETINVQVPTHVAGVLDFKAGAVATLITSFDIWGHNCPRIEIYGAEGSLSVPDPNTFGGPVKLLRSGAKEWEEIALTHEYAQNSRGLGVADMAMALRHQRAPRASGDIALHALEIMHGVHYASRDARYFLPETTVDKPAAVPAGKTVEKWDD